MKPDINKIVSAIDENGAIIEMDNYICGLALENLTEAQKNFYFNQELERAVNMDGFKQYFLNTSGNFAHQTIQSLQEIGAAKTANILQDAINQFPGSKVPSDQAVRADIVKQIEARADEEWNELDQKFFMYEDDLNALNLEYIRQNKDAF